LSISIPDLVTVRARHPEAVAEAAARRVRRPLLGDSGRLMIVAADHPARGALGVGDRRMAMANRADLLERLSPERAARAIRARLILVHGVDDPAVPYTESLRLAAARPLHTDVVLVHILEHVEPGRGGPSWTALRELGALLLAVYALAQSA